MTHQCDYVVCNCLSLEDDSDTVNSNDSPKIVSTFQVECITDPQNRNLDEPMTFESIRHCIKPLDLIIVNSKKSKDITCCSNSLSVNSLSANLVINKNILENICANKHHQRNDNEQYIDGDCIIDGDELFLWEPNKFKSNSVTENYGGLNIHSLDSRIDCYHHMGFEIYWFQLENNPLDKTENVKSMEQRIEQIHKKHLCGGNGFANCIGKCFGFGGIKSSNFDPAVLVYKELNICETTELFSFTKQNKHCMHKLSTLLNQGGNNSIHSNGDKKNLKQLSQRLIYYL